MMYRNSEPAHRAPLSQWQRDTMGKVRPMAHTSNREAFWTYVVVLFVVVLIVGMVA